MTGDHAADGSETELTCLKFVGEATADAMAAAGYDATDVREKSVSFRMLVDAGVNPGVAAKIRRWHSLSWSFDSGDDLDRRSEQVRGLEDDERDWVAASYGGDDDGDEEADDEDAEAAWVAAVDDRADDADGGDAVDAERQWVEDSNRSSAGSSDGGDDAEAEAAWVAESSAGTEADGSGDPVDAETAWRERSKPTPLTTIEGIGDAYAERLADAGVTSVRSLATADPELLSDVTGIQEGRVRTWYERARDARD